MRSVGRTIGRSGGRSSARSVEVSHDALELQKPNEVCFNADLIRSIKEFGRVAFEIFYESVNLGGVGWIWK